MRTSTNFQSNPKPIVCLLLAACIGFGFFSQKVAAQSYPVSLNERIEKSAFICSGRVIEQTPFESKNGQINTLNTVQISAWLKGHSTKTEIAVITLGGVLGDRATLVEPSLQVETGGEYLFFLQNEDPHSVNQMMKKTKKSLLQLLPYAENQGALTYQFGYYHDLHFPEKKTEGAVFAQISGLTKLSVLTPGGIPAEPRQPGDISAKSNQPGTIESLMPITSFSPNPTNAGTIVPGDFITITGSGFGASAGTVFFTNADDGGATFTSSGVGSDITAWSDNSITVKVARRAGTGPINVNGAITSGSNLTVNYSHLDINSNFSGFGVSTRQRYYHRNLNSAGGYTFSYNSTLPDAGSSMNSNADAKAAFERALTSWSCSTGINWKTGGATSNGLSGTDGVNVILFDNTLAVGVLGQAVSNFSGSASGGCSLANTVWWVADIDVRFAPLPAAGFPWEYGPALPSFSEYDFESVAVHELGHAHGLGHRIAAGEVMHYALANGSSVRTPATTEITGGTARVTYSQAATCFTPVGSGTPMLPLGALSITCPGNTTITEPYSMADFTGSATTSGGCGTITVTQSPVTGTSIPVGNQIVTLTATDGDGAMATCMFTVTVQASCPATGSIWYVDASAASGGTGSSWACAFQNLQNAIDAASSGHEIWVKAGTYKPTSVPTNCSNCGERDKTFYLKSDVAVYGGFDGAETMRSERDWAANTTTLSGDIGTVGNNTDNCHHVVLSLSDANTTVLDGFTVTLGNANGSGNMTNLPTTVNRNEGGGIYNKNTSLVIENCIVSTNLAAGFGAGIFNSNSPIALTNSTVSGNTAGNGGGVYNTSSAATFTGCTISNNTASNRGGGMSNDSSSPTITDCDFLSNTATNAGGGMLNFSASPIVTNCTFSNNWSGAESGGGVSNYNNFCTPTFDRCVFSGNSAANSAGMSFYQGTIKNCIFSGNSASGSNGALSVIGGATTITNCTFSGNSALTSSGGITCGVTFGITPAVSMTNCLIWNNRLNGVTGSAEANLTNSGSTITFAHNLIQNWNPSGTGNLDGITNAANSNYPNFVTPLDPTTAPSTSGDFHLTACSPVVNFGTNTGAPATDLFGNARPYGSTVDLGVHELQSVPIFPTIANAGTNQTVGTNSATMAANTPTVGTGAWSLVSGSGTITTPGSPTTTITNLGVGANTFRWTISNSPCTASTSDVTVTYSISVSLNCPMNMTTPACQTQAAVDLAFSNWLATATASGGCNGMLTNDNTGAPSACGGSAPVTFTYTSTCEPFTSTCQATFTVAAPTSPTPVFANCTNNSLNLNCNPATLPSCAGIAGGGFGGSVTASNSCGSVPVNCTPGEITVNGCNRSQVFTFEATACGQTVTCTRTFNWTQVTPPSFNGTCGNGVINLGCNPATLPSCDPNVTASNQCGPIPVTCNVGAIIVNGCNRQQSLMYTANATGCGTFSTCIRIFNWQVATAPVFANCGNTIDLGCNPATLPICNNVQTTPFGGAVTATNECGNVAGVTCSAGSVVINGCNRTQVFTFSVTGCSMTSTCTRTFTWQVVTAPVFDNCTTGTTNLGCNPATLPSCDPNVTATSECGPATVVCTAGAVTMSGCNRTQIFTYVATGGCGLTNTCTRTFTWQEDPVAILECPGSTTTPAGQSQVDIDAEFNIWLSDASFTGGCDGILTNNNTGAPAACGGSTTVTFTLTTACRPVQTCQATFTVAAAATGSVWYVNSAAPGGGNGASWDCAFQNLQDAIDAASSGHEVWVKAGTYVPTEDPFGNASPTDPRDKTFYLKNGVAVYGGFAGTETLRSQRNPAANVTTLSGDLGAVGNSDNCYHVVVSLSDANTTVLDGFTISGGNANGTDGLTVEGVSVFRHSGGGVYNNSSSPSIANCLFSGNASGGSGAGFGGGMFNFSSSSPSLANCTFSSNSANHGAGVYNSIPSSTTLNGCIFSGNSAAFYGGGMLNYSATPTLTNCLFSGNSAGASGGGMSSNFNSAPVLMNCTFSGNKSGGGGGGMENISSTPTLTNCIVWNNRVGSTTGSANANMYNSSSTPVVTYSLIQNVTDGTNNNLNGSTHGSNTNYPDFVTQLDPATAPSTAGDFHLTDCSPVVNIGTNTDAPATDLFGNARPFGPNVDMGIHELQTAPTAPVAACKNTTIYLDGTGAATLVASSLDNGSTGCAPLSFSAAPNTFNCSNLGANPVTLTVTGINNVSSTCSSTVTVSDNLPPNALCRDFVKNLGADGTASITPAEVDNLSTDNCGTVNLVSASPNSFTCSNLGINVVTLTVNDGHGNTSTCTGNVTIADITAPTATCQNISVNLNAGGTASISASQINNGSSDNCGIASMSVSPSSFSCANIGNQTVTLTVTDNASLMHTCTATVAVSDATAPTAVCQNISVNLGANGTATLAASAVNNGSSDNCGIASLSVSPSSFGCANVGNQSVTLTVTDNSNLQSTCLATVAVSDATAPVAVCQNITVNLDGNGNASITGGQIDGGSTDNCGIASLGASPNTFTISNLGTNNVTLTVTDDNSLTQTCTAIVTVTNTNLPNAVCQPFTAVLGSNGSVALTPANVDGGSSAIGGIASMSVSPDTRACINIGVNNVTLTVVGNNGQSATCLAAVTVQDNTDPVPVCQNISVNLSGSTANITPSQVLNTALSSDNCGTVTAASVSPNSFNCNNLGTNTVTLTANDGHGNDATCTATVTVNDATNPVIVCQNILVNLSAGGTANIAASQVYNAGASSDNCGTINLVSVAPAAFTCSNLGANTVTLTANDGHGNMNTCTATVTIADNLAPSALCRDIVVQLDGSGNATITASQVNNGSSDNCALGTLTVNPNAFTLSNLGINPVMLTVPDGNGNSSSCMAQVTVENNQLPNAVCQNISRNLSAGGTVSLTPNDVDGGSTALGGIASRTVSPTSLNCSNLGANTVTLTVVGNNGQQASCNATVTVSDNLAPTATCQNVGVNLSSGGTASITEAQVNGGSTDNCGTVNLVSVSPNSFTCSNLGTNMVTLTINDGNGNTNTCTVTVTVSDNLAPTATCQNVNVSLVNGMASVAPAQINNGSTDNCSTVNLLSVVPNSFTCSNLGANTVTLNITDGSGNPASCTATVTVSGAGMATWYDDGDMDSFGDASDSQMACVQPSGYVLNDDDCDDTNGNINPSETEVCNTIDDDCDSQIDEGNVCDGDGDGFTVAQGDCNDGNINIYPTATEVCNGVDDDCDTQVDDGLTFLNYYLDGDGDSFGAGSATNACQSPGSNYVTQNGDCNDAVFAINPFATEICNGVDDNCTGGIDEGNVCDGDGDGFTVAQGDCDDGNINIYPTAIEVCNGVDDDCDTQIDEGAMLTFYEDGDMDGFGNVSVSQQACVAPMGFVGNSTDCNDGNSQINLAATEVCNGVDDDCDNLTDGADPNLVDNTPPMAFCKNHTAELGTNGEVLIAPADVFQSGSDNCGAVNLQEVAPSWFNCDNLGANVVTLTVNDGHGNTGTCTATVTIEDNLAPTVTCKNFQVALGQSGMATIQPINVYQNSSDNCGPFSLVSVVPNSFTCSILGPNIVTLTVTDGQNLATCTATVTVADILAPTAVCKAATIYLNANGTAALTPAMVDNGSSDNCNVSLGLSQSSFTCANIGQQMVTLTASDPNSNVSTCTALVQIVDNLPPTALCHNATVYLNASGQATLGTAQIDNGSTDNCGISASSVLPNSFNCNNLGTNTVTLTVNDVNGHSATCNATVTVVDNLAPVLACQNISLQLNGNGSTSIAPAQVFDAANSSDVCGSIQLVGVTPNLFDCGDIGTNTVTLTASDGQGNTATCSATVTIGQFVVITSVVADPSTCGSSNGSIVITASAPGGQLRYSINNFQSFSLVGEFQNLPPGTYPVSVMAGGTTGCMAFGGTVVVGSVGSAQTWFKDFDGDGYSDGNSQSGCTNPGTGWFLASQLTAASGDCNDSDAAQHPGQVWYKDLDNDGWSDGVTAVQCLRPTGYKTANECTTSGDCDDSRNYCYPNAPELCNSIDDDCDGEVDEGLADLVFNGNVTFSNQSQANAWSECYTVINGNLLIQNGTVDSLPKLANLRKVTGNVTIKLTVMDSLSWLMNLDTIGGILTINNNSQLGTLHGLDSLASVGSNLKAFYNPVLTDCCAIHDLLNDPNGVGGTKSIFSNDTGCDNLSEIALACDGGSNLVAPIGCPDCPAVPQTFLEQGQSILVFPNPAAERVHVHMGQAFTTGKVRLFSLAGRVLLQEELEAGTLEFHLNLESLSSGVYYMQVLVDGESFRQKLYVK